MTAIYRIQNPQGRGPFQPGLAKHWLIPNPERDAFPPFMIDFPYLKMDPNYHHGCACTSPEQLKRWFSPQEYAKLKNLGYQLVKIPTKSITIIAKSPHQCVIKSRQPLHKLGQAIDYHSLAPI